MADTRKARNGVHICPECEAQWECGCVDCCYPKTLQCRRCYRLNTH